MTLALRLGRTLEELGESMSSQEFSLWLAFDRRSPIGDVRADLNAGIVAATIANYAGKRRGDGQPAALPGDFMPLSRRHKEAVLDNPDPLVHFRELGA